MTSRMPLRILAATAAALLAFAACSDDDVAGNNNALDAGADAASDAATGESVTFVMVTLPSADGTFVPVEGVTVAFDAPGGGRVEEVTGADGKVTFTGIDWDLGEAALTAHHPEYSMVTALGITPTQLAESWGVWDGAYDIILSVLIPVKDEVTVEGTATGLQDVFHRLTVNAPFNLNADDEWSGTGSQRWSIDVPRGQPFVLQAVEHDYAVLPSGQGYDRPVYQMLHMDYGPLTADASEVELDFDAFGMTTYTADVSVLMPSQTDSPIRTGAIPYCYFCAENSNFCHGWPTYLDVVNNQSQIDISWIWVEPDWAENPFWFCYVGTNAGEAAQTVVPGAPQEGAQATLMDVPTWITPADTSVAHPLSEPLEWAFYEDTELTSLVIRRSGRDVWYILCGPNATEATIPEPPSSANLSQLLGSVPRISVYGGTANAARTRFARYAISRSALIEY